MFQTVMKLRIKQIMAALYLCECTLLTVLLTAATCQGFASPQVAGQSFLASQTEDGITLSSAIVVPSDTVTTATTTFPNEEFPYQCGVDPSISNIGRPNSTRCEVTVVRDSSSSKVAAMVPTVNGAGIVLFDDDPVLALIDQYMIPLPPSLDCNLTSFVNLPDKLLGVCYGSITSGDDETSVQILRVVINFNQLNQSTLEKYGQNMITLSSTEFSNVFYLPICNGAEPYLYWFDDGFLFDLRTDIQSAGEQRYDTNVGVCFAGKLRRVIPFRENFLISYCSNNTIIEVDVCDRGGDTVPFVGPSPTRFYCSGSETIFLQQGVENLSLVSSIHQSTSIPFPLDPSPIYTGDCIDITDILFFVGSSADGTIVLTNVLDNFTTILAEDATVPHQAIQNRYILYSNSTSSALLDLTCPSPTSPVHVFNDSFHLANFDPNDNYSCNTMQPVEPSATITVTSTPTEEIMNLTTTEFGPPTTKIEVIRTETIKMSPIEVTPTASVAVNGTSPVGGLSGGLIAGVTIGVILLVVIVCGVILVGMVIKCVKGKKTRRYVRVLWRRAEESEQPTPTLKLKEITEETEKTLSGQQPTATESDNDDGNNPPSLTTNSTNVVSPEIHGEDDTAFASHSLHPPQVRDHPVADSEASTPESNPQTVQPLPSVMEAASRVPSPPPPPDSQDFTPPATPPTGSGEQSVIESTPKLCPRDESDERETRGAQEVANNSRRSAQVAGSSASVRTLPQLTPNESNPEDNSSAHNSIVSTISEENTLVSAIPARPDNNNNVSMVTSSISLATNKSDITWSSHLNGDINVRQRYSSGNSTHNSTNGNASANQGATPSLPNFQIGSPIHQDSTEYTAQEIQPIEASRDRTRNGPETQHSTETGTLPLVPPSNLHVIDHEQVFRERQQHSERTMYIAGKIEGSVQPQGDDNED